MNIITERLIHNNANFIREKSGLVLADIVSLQARKVKCNPFAGASYKELRSFLKYKHAVVNVRNADYRCLGYAMLAAINIHKHPARVTDYEVQFFSEYKLDTIDYLLIPTPNTINEISKTLNTDNSVIGLYTDDGRGRYPMITTKNHFYKKVVLLYWNKHFAWISNILRFLSDLTINRHTMFWCTQCFYQSNIDSQ